MVLLLLGALGAGRQEAQATCREGESGEPLPLLLSTVLGDAATCGDKGVVELLLEVEGGGGGGSSDDGITWFRTCMQHADPVGCWIIIAVCFGGSPPLRSRLPR